MSESTKKFNFFTMFWDGFRNMTTLGKTLWTIVIIKLVIMFFVLRPLFFQNFLNANFEDDESRAEFVMEELLKDTKE